MTIILNGTTGITTPGITNQGVVEFTAGSVSAPSITTTSDTNTGIYFPAADTIAFTEGGVESMRIDSSGNVGIGTASPQFRLDVINNSTYQLRLATATGQDYVNGGLYLGAFGTSDPYYYGYMRWDQGDICLKIGSQHGNSTGGILFLTGVGSGAQTERARITAAGDLSVGAATPGYTAGSRNVIFVNGATSSLVGLAYGGTNAAYIYADSGGTTFHSEGSRQLNFTVASAAAIVFSTNNIERARITAAGGLLVGNTSAQSYSGTAPITELYTTSINNTDPDGGTLALYSTSSFAIDKGAGTVFGFKYNTAGNFVTAARVRGAKENATDGNFAGYLAFDTRANGGNLTERARITSVGDFYLGYTSGGSTSTGILKVNGLNCKEGLNAALGGNTINFFWNGNAQLWIDFTNIGNIAFSSDYRIKKNVVTQTENALARIAKLRPIVYEHANYGTLFKADGVRREGFIAHEVQEVIPSGAEGEKDEENRIQNLRVDAILAVVVKAIQELSAKVTALESK